MAVTAPRGFDIVHVLRASQLPKLVSQLPPQAVPFLASFDRKLFASRPVRDSVFGSVQ
ncbi:hypothetical protein ACHAO4_003506 [Trichoderma viride]